MDMFLEYSGKDAVSTLFGPNTDLALGKAMGIFYNAKFDQMDDVLAECFRLCRDHTNDHAVVARILASCHVIHPGLHHPALLGYANTLLSADGKVDVPDYFQLGLVEGLFTAACWMDEHWKGESAFSDKFPKTVKLIVMARWTAPADDTFRGNLSNLVKKWVRAEGSYIRGQRLGQVTRVIYDLADRYGPESSLEDIGDLVLDQIAHGLVSSTIYRDKLLSCTSTYDKLRTAKEVVDETFGKFFRRAEDVALLRAQGIQPPAWDGK